jgi:hypothetical protein
MTHVIITTAILVENLGVILRDGLTEWLTTLIISERAG